MKKYVFSVKRKSIINTNNSPLHVIVGHYGYEQTAPTKATVYSHDYPTYRLHIIVNGSVSFAVNNAPSVKLSAGSVYLLAPNANISYQTDKDDPAQIFWVSFSGQDALHYSKLMGFTNSYYLDIPDKFSKKIISLMKANFLLNDEVLMDGVFLKNFIQIAEILYLLTANHSSPSVVSKNDKKTNYYLSFIIDYVEEHYAEENLNLDVFSHQLHLHRNYLSSLFKKTMGVTFREYLTQKRIEKSIALLTKTELTIKEIAYEVGYSDPFYYSKLFKKYNLVSPKAYRNNQKNNDLHQ